MHVFSQSNLQKFKQAIAEVDWNNSIDLTDDINTSFQRFYAKLILLVTKTCIMVRSPSRKNNPKKPWMSPNLLRCINKRDKLYKNSINNGNDPICLRIYKNYKNAVSKLLRNVKNYFVNKFTETCGSPAKTWKIIKSVISTGNSIIPFLMK